MRIVAAAHRQAAIARRADRHAPRRLITDVAIHIGVHHILPGRAEGREGLAKFVPVLGGVHVEEHQTLAVLQRPAQGNLAGLAGKQLCDNGAVARSYHIENHVGLAFDVNRFLPMLRFNPSCGSFVLPLRIELFDEVVFHGRSNIGESPADTLVVADNHERNARQRNSGHVEVAGGCLKVRRKPQVWHLVVEVHVVREQRFPRNRMLTGNDPVVRPRPEGVVGGSSPSGVFSAQGESSPGGASELSPALQRWESWKR